MKGTDEFYSGATLCLLLGLDPEELAEAVGEVNRAAEDLGRVAPITKSTDQLTGDTRWSVDGDFIQFVRATTRPE